MSHVKPRVVDAAILFEPDGYVLEGRQLMGRRAAGAAFLRAAVAGRQGKRVWAYTPSQKSALTFQRVIQQLDPTVEAGWIRASRVDLLAEREVLYRPDSALGIDSRLRLRAGPGSYALCGVTHTLASEGALDGFVALLNGPVMAWDALICTSTAAVGVFKAVAEAETEYQRWRLGVDYRPPDLMTPVIPLGVHSQDFAVDADSREAARRTLGLEADEVVVLFAGRLSMSGKAHPYQMLQGMELAAQATGKKLVFLQAGQFFNEPIERTLRSAAEQFAPSVRCLFVDGEDDSLYAAAFAGSDLFMSLSDNIQETFGITPLEAMASGLPVLVSDWNGYKDTVRDGVDGFRVETWSPGPGAGEHMARDFESAMNGFNYYLSRTSTTVSINMAALVERLTELVSNPDLRRRMGQAGLQRARTVFDWAVVYRQYQALWAEQTAIRQRALADPQRKAWLSAAPWAQAGRLDPFLNFAHYPTSHIGLGTLVAAAPAASLERFNELVAHSIFATWTPNIAIVEPMFTALAAGEMRLGDLAHAAGVNGRAGIEVVGRLAKMGLLILRAPAA